MSSLWHMLVDLDKCNKFIFWLRQMGIKSLTKVLTEHAPNATKLKPIKSYFSRKVAIDCSMWIYQFLVAVRTGGNNMQDSEGNTTSHLIGLYYRTIRMLENGIEPVFVFDGKPPDLKSVELNKRKANRDKAEKDLQKAKDEGNAEDEEKFNRRLTKVTPEHNAECQKLLTLMGVPFIIAPCEAEAQAAELAKKGKVFAVGTEDADTLCFATPVLLRNLSAADNKKLDIKEITLSTILEDMNLTQSQFIDLCILLGCDYLESIKGLGPKSAMNLIKKYGSIDKIVEAKASDKNGKGLKFDIPEVWDYQQARELFINHPVIPAEDVDFKWIDPDEQGLVDYLVTEKNFR
eukprot:NODE_52_length_30984_cov_1.383358.p14 type:complete len:347 gc:universal NODE_52_length_30984_cov_1.383358:21835-22875(+)